MQWTFLLVLTSSHTWNSGQASSDRDSRQDTGFAQDLNHLVAELTKRVDRVEAANRQLREQLEQLYNDSSHLRSRLSGLESGEELSELSSSRPRAKVAFHVWLYNTTSFTMGQPLVFTQVTTNQGQGYDPSTGRFTAPSSGTYLFLVMCGIDAWAGVSSEIEVLHNDVTVGYVISSDPHNPDTTAGHVVLSVAIGDMVWLKSSGKNNSYYGNMWTTFSGILL